MTQTILEEQFMNIFDTIPLPAVGQESFKRLLDQKHFRIEHICSRSFKNGTWYDQETSEWVLLLSGWAILDIESDVRRLCAGDYLLLQPHQRHRVLETSEETHWLGIHFNS